MDKVRVAIVTQSFFTGGGVPAVARMLTDGLNSQGFHADVFDVATSARDENSRRIVSPTTWVRRSLEGETVSGVRKWGANAAEIEVMRYRPRRSLTEALKSYDLIQVVAGSPALGCAVVGLNVPVVLQTATRARWERVSRHAADSGLLKSWRQVMTAMTGPLERRAVRGADCVLVENSRMAQWCVEQGQQNVQLVFPGVDIDRFSPGGPWRSDGPILISWGVSHPANSWW